ncbi:MAG: hypothetical protein AMXMBFR33_73440 [Candidatus Xenobia bacterium]
MLNVKAQWLSVLLLLILAPPVRADDFQDALGTIQRNASLLAARARPEGVTLTWGQDLAAQDLERLAQAASAIKIDQVEDLLDVGPQINELGTAATRVRSTASISVLDAEGQQLALATVEEAKRLQKEVNAARNEVEDRLARYRDYGPRFGLGLGYGGWGWNRWGYGYGGWGYGGWGGYYPGIYRPCVRPVYVRPVYCVPAVQGPRR